MIWQLEATLISQVSMDSVISHEKYQTIISEKEEYKKWKKTLEL